MLRFAQAELPVNAKSVFLTVLLVAAAGFPGSEPLFLTGSLFRVPDPVKAYSIFDNLDSGEREFRFESDSDFTLSAALLVPVGTNPGGRFSGKVYQIDNGVEIPIAILDGINTPWLPWRDGFYGDDYLIGPQIRKDAASGIYKISLTPDSGGKYILMTGQEEEISIPASVRALSALPLLKRDYHRKSPLTIFSAVGGVYMVGFLGIIHVLAWGIYQAICRISGRFSVKKYHGRAVSAGGRKGRFIWLTMSLGLTAAAVHFWNPWLLGLSLWISSEAISGRKIFPGIGSRSFR